MDELGGFEPTDTTGFIQIESIRIKKYVWFQWPLSCPDNLRLIDGHKPISEKAKLGLSQRTCTESAFETILADVNPRRPPCLYKISLWISVRWPVEHATVSDTSYICASSEAQLFD